MKKKIVTTVLMLCMAFALCACGGNTDNPDGSEKQNTQQGSENVKDSESTGNNSESTGANSESESESESELAEGQALYKVTIVDESGKAWGGIMVQVCDEETCFMPAATNADGVVEFKLDEAEGYKAKVMNCPEGYEAVDEDYVNFESGKTELTLKIKAVQ